MTIFPQYEEQLRELARRECGLAPVRERGRWRRPRGALAIGLPIAVAVVVVALVLALGGHRKAPAPTPATAAPRPAWLVRLVRLATHFSVLRGPTTTPPLEVARRFRALQAAGAAADLGLTHRVVLAQGTLWVLPERTQICLALAVPGQVKGLLGAGCNGTERAVTHGMKINVGGVRHPDRPPGPGNPLRLWFGGLVPDGTVSVFVYRRDAAVVTAPVTGNVFAIKTMARITSTRDVRDRPPFPTNAAGETFGSAGGGPAGPVRARDIPDLIDATGRSPDGTRRVTGFVRRAQLDAHSCANVKTPKQAVHCSRHATPATIPLVAIDGHTVIGRFTIER